MKPLRQITTVAIVLVFAAIIPTYAATLTVCSSSCDFTSIQAAVDAASDGDTIELGAEAFFEGQIDIENSLNIQGAGADKTIIDFGGGDGLRVVNGVETFTLSDLTLQNASWDGAVYVQGSVGTTSLNHCIVRGNIVGMTSGQMMPLVTSRTTLLNHCTVSGNIVGIASQMFPYFSGAAAAPVIINGTTISDNTVGVQAGGQGIHWIGYNGNVHVVNSTITHNQVGVSVVAGGCSPDPPWECTYVSGSVTSSTIAYNDCGTSYGAGPRTSFRLQDTIVASNTTDVCGDFGMLLGNNLLGPTDPLLLPLADNGGPTPTHALHPDSPAIDMAGDECEPTDQRGMERPVDGDGDGIAKCDVGAFEYVPPASLVNQLIEHVESLDLHHGIENNLLAKLNAAWLVLTDVPTGNDHAAVNILGAFINAVEARHGKKIAAADADALIDAAEEIIGFL